MKGRLIIIRQFIERITIRNGEIFIGEHYFEWEVVWNSNHIYYTIILSQGPLAMTVVGSVMDGCKVYGNFSYLSIIPEFVILANTNSAGVAFLYEGKKREGSQAELKKCILWY